MTEDQIRRQLLLTPCKSKKALYNWFKVYLEVDLFDQTVSRFASSNPMDFAWDIYSFCMWNKEYQENPVPLE